MNEQTVSDFKNLWGTKKMAERVGFEPTVPDGTPHFQCGAFDHSTISPQQNDIPCHPKP